ncbi:MAG: flagellar export chaperone FliS [Chthonomonas sp.]|nr:flagellar export chaperone FliS [Chthonomonas sp.]
MRPKPNPYVDTYRQNSVLTASPLQLVILLYDGALRFLHAAKEAMLRKDLYEQNANLQKAQSIVSELSAGVNVSQGGELAENLLGLYSYCFNEIVDANLNDKVENVDRCISVLNQLRESWIELEKQQRQGPSEDLPLAS